VVAVQTYEAKVSVALLNIGTWTFVW